MRSYLIIIITLIFGILSKNAYCSISITLNNPTNFGLFQNSVLINANITSTYDIKSVQANVLNRNTSLLYNSSTSTFSANLDLTGLPQDTLLLVVKVIDFYNNVDSVTRYIIYDKPPTVTFGDSSLVYFARPFLSVTAKCKTDTNNACRIVYEVFDNNNQEKGAVIFESGGTYYGQFDLSFYDGDHLTLNVRAIDKFGLQTLVQANVYVVANPYLKDYYTAPGQNINDFNYDKIISSYKPTQDSLSVIYTDIQSQLSTHLITVFDSSDKRFYNPPPASYLVTKEGALLSYFPIKTGVFNTLVEWTPGHKQIIDTLQHSLSLAGEYYDWFTYSKNYDTTYLHFKKFGSNEIVSFTKVWPQPSVEKNGSITYIRDSIFYRYKNGVNEQIIKPVNIFNIENSPSFYSDGKRIIYSVSQAASLESPASILLFDGISVSMLGATTDPYFYPSNDFFGINNGFAVYSKAGAFNQNVLWLKDSLNNENQITPFTTSCYLKSIAANGDISFYNYNSDQTYLAYIAKKNNKVVQLYRTFESNVYNVDSNWYVAVGNRIFSVDFNIEKNEVIPIRKEIKKDSLYYFTTTDFDAAFKGPGHLINVQIIGYPKHGILTYNNQTYQGQIINHAFLAQLKYTPSQNFIGADTIRWNGSNGVQYTANDTLLILHVSTTLPVNLLSFTATAKGKINELVWSTASEINSNYFEIERSNNGEIFNVIGHVTAVGNSNFINNYSFNDFAPLADKNYYKLKILDRDGNFIYSGIRVVNGTLLFSINIYPNPVSNLLSLNIQSSVVTIAQIKLIGLNGKTLAIKQVKLSPGITSYDLNTSSLTAGNYYIQVNNNSDKLSLPFIKK